jgi:hypothetical protein
MRGGLGFIHQITRRVQKARFDCMRLWHGSDFTILSRSSILMVPAQVLTGSRRSLERAMPSRPQKEPPGIG